MPKSSPARTVNEVQSEKNRDRSPQGKLVVRQSVVEGRKKLVKRIAVAQVSHNAKTGKRRMAVTFATKSASKKKSSALRGRGSGSGGGDGSITKKRRRFRPGTVALREIRDIQGGKHATTNCIRKLPMYNVIREALQEVNSDLMITAGAVAALQQVGEYEIVKQFEVAQLLAIHAKRETVQPEDLVAANRVRTIHPGKSHMPFDQTKIYEFRGDGPKKRDRREGGLPNMKLVKRDRNNITKKIRKVQNASKNHEHSSKPLLPGVTGVIGNIRFTVLPPENNETNTITANQNDEDDELNTNGSNEDVKIDKNHEKEMEEEKEKEKDAVSFSLSSLSLSTSTESDDTDEEIDQNEEEEEEDGDDVNNKPKVTVLPEKEDDGGNDNQRHDVASYNENDYDDL